MRENFQHRPFTLDMVTTLMNLHLSPTEFLVSTLLVMIMPESPCVSGYDYAG
jgi:hypothetical protein